MSVSTRHPRYRYIAFRLEGPRAFRRDEVLEAIRATTPRMRLVDFAGASGLVRTTNTERDAAIRALTAIETITGERVGVTTIGTSGTIRAATRKYLRKRARPPNPRKEPL